LEINVALAPAPVSGTKLEHERQNGAGVQFLLASKFMLACVYVPPFGNEMAISSSSTPCKSQGPQV